MVYGKIFYNNIKEYTPTWMKTIPYSQVTKTTLGRRPQVVGKFNADPKVKAGWIWLRENVQKNTTLWQVFIFANAFLITHIFMDPIMAAYVSTNRHRSLDYAIAKEKEYKRKNESAEN